MKGMYLKTTELIVSISKYENGRKCILLIDAEDGSVYAKASVNVPQCRLKDDEVLIKDYSENQGVLNFLKEYNIVHDTGRIYCSGYVILNICKLLPENEWNTKNQKENEKIISEGI